MQKKKTLSFLALEFLVQVVLPGATSQARAQAEKASYPAMAPLDQYLMPDRNSEIALARSAAPASVSDGAEVMVLGPKGYATAVRGTNGFLCIVERSWGAATDDPDFWNPKVRAPICFNPPAARTFVPIFLMKTKLVVAGKSKTEIVAATASAMDKKELPALETGAMCYMTSKQQYLSDRDMSWHPHLMFFVPGDAAKSWGANLPGSPVMAADDPGRTGDYFPRLGRQMVRWDIGSADCALPAIRWLRIELRTTDALLESAGGLVGAGRFERPTPCAQGMRVRYF